MRKPSSISQNFGTTLSNSLRSRAAWIDQMMRGASLWRGLTVSALLLGFAVTLALAACPQWHELLHPGADHANHECAVTMILHGGCDHTPPPQITVCIPASEPILLLTAREDRIASAVSPTHRFGRAPPVLG